MKLDQILVNVKPQEVKQYGDVLEVMHDGYADIDCKHNLQNYDCGMCNTEKTFNPDFNHDFKHDFFPTATGFGVKHKIIKPHDPIQELHDTYKVDRYDNMYDNHTTVVTTNKLKKRFNLDDF